MIAHGDCREVMATMDANSVDAIVTDPPYGLSFMGKGWDKGVPGVEFWQAAYRVMKPGAYLLAFGGTRTFHRMAVAIEDAGFEIRDTLSWLYGSGFPKSLDVGKAIDKRRDDWSDIEKVVRYLASARQASGVSRKQVEEHFGTVNIGQAFFTITPGSNPRVPMWDQWLQLKALLGFGDEMDAEVWRLNGRKGKPGDNWDKREVIGQSRGVMKVGGLADSSPWSVGAKQAGIDVDITAPATDAAKQWDGWGTALKPAWEPIIVARKPLEGTVAHNVLTHGTGAINVDACRIDNPTGESAGGGWGWKASKGSPTFGQITENTVSQQHPSGRWPSNVVLDDEAAALLDQQSGERPSRPAKYAVSGEGVGYHDNKGEVMPGFGGSARIGYANETGGASRFFYTAKASRSERNAGLEGMPERETTACYENGNGLSGRTQIDGEWINTNNPRKPKSNHHPTVKPISLMRWLCRLVTPPGGVVLDPFAGSGTTGCAASLEGFAFIGIEQDAEYVTIAERRIAHWANQTRQTELIMEQEAS